MVPWLDWHVSFPKSVKSHDSPSSFTPLPHCRYKVQYYKQIGIIISRKAPSVIMQYTSQTYSGKILCLLSEVDLLQVLLMEGHWEVTVRCVKIPLATSWTISCRPGSSLAKRHRQRWAQAKYVYLYSGQQNYQKAQHTTIKDMCTQIIVQDTKAELHPLSVSMYITLVSITNATEPISRFRLEDEFSMSKLLNIWTCHFKKINTNTPYLDTENTPPSGDLHSCALLLLSLL